MAKVGFGFFFLYLRHVSLFVRSLPRWRLSRETWVEERDKTNSNSEEKATLLLADPYRKTHFSFKEKPKEVICHSGRNCRNNMKGAFSKDFSPRQMHLAFQ